MDLVIRCGAFQEGVMEFFRRGCIHHIFVAKILEANAHKEASMCDGPTLPESFVREHEKILSRDGAVLLTHRSPKYVAFAINKSPDVDYPDKFRFHHGWESFVVDNRIGEGDFLIFSLNLSQNSHFDVYIFPANENPVGDPAMAPTVHHWPRSTSAPQEVNLDVLNGEASRPRRQSPPEHEEPQVISDLALHSRFSKRLSITSLRQGGSTSVTFNSLELPAAFRRRHGSRLRTKVTLQGTAPQSPEYVVCCSWHHCAFHQQTPNVRLFLRYGWVEFCEANDLEVGEKLEFTMTADSYFVVRKIAD